MMNKHIFAFVLLCSTAGYTAYGQGAFYSYSLSTLNIADTLTVGALKFRVPIDEYEEFQDLWNEFVEDLGEDSDDDEHLYWTREVEIPENSESLFSVYSEVLDLHDSAQVKLSFADTSGFIVRTERREFTMLETAGKKWVLEVFTEYKNQELEEKEELLDDARDLVEELRDDIHDHEESIQDKQRKIQETKTKIAEARQALNVVAEEIGQQRQTLARLELNAKEARSDAEREIRRLESRQESLQDDIRDWDEEIFEWEEEISEHRVEIGEKNIELDQAMNGLSRARAAYEELKIEIASYGAR
ncbi:MAG: hypothetical protein HWE14_07460 [Flavobacteriia bacterium]|nr:hypothetical protein [Flavobacteriia bacterium]